MKNSQKGSVALLVLGLVVLAGLSAFFYPKTISFGCGGPCPIGYEPPVYKCIGISKTERGVYDGASTVCYGLPFEIKTQVE